MAKKSNIKSKHKNDHFNFKNKYKNKRIRYPFKLIFNIIIIAFCLFSLTKNKKKLQKIKFKYFACFGCIVRKENLYIRDLISYYLNIGYEKFIFGDNNFPNIEKISDVTQDYINNGIVDIIEVFGSSMSQGEFFSIIYKKYKKKCAWISFFDIDEYLRMHSENNSIISVKKYLSNPIFNKCESISINWLMYSDNNLLYYDNRSVLERFTTPLYKNRENRLVKSIVRGNLDKKVFSPLHSNHVPHKGLIICNSMGKVIKHYSGFYLKPPLLKKAYLMHYSTKTAEEFIQKIKRGSNQNVVYNITEKIKDFFNINDFTEEKLELFEKAFNRTFNQFRNYKNSSNKINIDVIYIIVIFLCLFI